MNKDPMKLLLVDDDDDFRRSFAKWMRHKLLDRKSEKNGTITRI